MKLIIDISDDLKDKICKSTEDWATRYVEGWNLEIARIIRNGTPLPKGHGRLIDADETLKAMNTWDKFGYTETGCLVREPGNDYVPYVYYEDMVKAVSGAPTIIEADRGEEA